MLRNATTALIFMLTAALSPMAHAAEPLTEFVTNLDGYIDIAPDGSVKDYSLKPLLATDNRVLVHALDRRIRSWHFTPITNDGQPVIAHVLMGITLQADASADGKNLAVRLKQVQFYDPPPANASGKPSASLRPPSYPGDPMRAGVGAKVMMLFKIDDDGHVLERDVSQIDLLLPNAIGSSMEARYAKDFREATLAAAKKWVFPAHYLTSCGSPCIFQVPIGYEACDCLMWSGLRSMPMPPLPWMKPETPIVRLDSSGGTHSARQLLDPAQAVGLL